MAKRRQLEVPSPETLRELEEGFARETPHPGTRAPIADVAADAAARTDPLPQHLREENARDRADAKLLRDAQKKGLILTELPIDTISVDTLTRDRITLDDAEMAELKLSISKNGLRMPIEVFKTDTEEDTGAYALISGYRRLTAMRQLHAVTGDAKYGLIAAFIRAPETLVDAMVAMIEENEVRSPLSQYERGRAAAMAVYQEIFSSVDEAVNALFASASKAKRSKIRSFALVHEELGDMLRFATDLNERQCLRIATGLRGGKTEAMRKALEAHDITDSAGEWAVLEPYVAEAEGAPPDPSRGGRPRKLVERGTAEPLSNGITLEKVKTEDGFSIRLRGELVDDRLIKQVMERVKDILEGM